MIENQIIEKMIENKVADVLQITSLSTSICIQRHGRRRQPRVPPPEHLQPRVRRNRHPQFQGPIPLARSRVFDPSSGPRHPQELFDLAESRAAPLRGRNSGLAQSRVRTSQHRNVDFSRKSAENLPTATVYWTLDFILELKTMCRAVQIQFN